MNQDADTMTRARGAHNIAAEAKRLAAAAGVAPIGVTWDRGEQLLPRPSHVLELFRGTAYATATFSDAELTHYPDRLTKARTEVKLAAIVTDLVRRRSAANFGGLRLPEQRPPSAAPNGGEQGT